MNPPQSPSLTTALIEFVLFLGVSFVVFLAMREVWCWYWKINAALVELRAIRGLLERAEQRATPPARGPTAF